MKILNLYAGIGGNRKLWGGEHEIVAIENVPHIAEVYRQLWPNDKVIETDAHQYLLDHFKEFDFIWSSPPCPTHSKMNTALHPQGHIRYPDMSLYQEIIFLKQWFKCRWVIENVVPYYQPFIAPRIELDRHLFWSNFFIPPYRTGRGFNIARATEAELISHYGIDLPAIRDSRQMLRNVVDPLVGLHILESSQKHYVQSELFPSPAAQSPALLTP